MRLIMIYGKVLPDEWFRCVLWFGKFNLFEKERERERGRGKQKGIKRKERDPNAYTGIRSETFSTARNFIRLFLSGCPFLDFISKRFSESQHRDCVDLTKLLKAQYIAKFRKSLLIKCLQAGLWRWHNVEFVYKMIITRTHWHIYRAMEGCPSIGPRH